MTAARLGEVLAHAAYHAPQPLATVLETLGDGAEVAEVEQARQRLHRAIDGVGGASSRSSGTTPEVGIDELRAFVTAYDASTSQLRTRASNVPRERRVDRVPAPKPSIRPDLSGTWCADREQVREGMKAPLAPLSGPNIVRPFVPHPIDARRPPVDGTVFISEDHEVAASLPFAASVAEELDGYVALTIALASGEDREVVLTRFGLSEDDRQRLSRLWAARISRDPALAERFRARLRELRK